MLHKLKSACSITKTNSEQVHLQVFRKSLRTNSQIPLFNRQPNNWDQQQQRLSNPNPSCGQAPKDLRKSWISKPTDQKLLNP